MRVKEVGYYFEYPDDTRAAFTVQDRWDVDSGFSPDTDPEFGLTDVHFVYAFFLREGEYTIPIKPINSKNLAYAAPRKVQKAEYNYQEGVYIRAYESRCFIFGSTPEQDKELYDLVTGRTKLPPEVEEELRKI